MVLVPITEDKFDVTLEIAYATTENFTGKPVYDQGLAFLHTEAVPYLERAIELAARQGYRLKIWDVFRPQEAQKRLWAHTPNPDYVCPPEKGSPHSRGVAIDLTLVDKEGCELDMGTPFDDFRPLAHHGAEGLSAQIEANRYLLLGIMTTAGWDFFRNEWWHYQLFDSKRFPVLSDAELGLGMIHPTENIDRKQA